MCHSHSTFSLTKFLHCSSSLSRPSLSGDQLSSGGHLSRQQLHLPSPAPPSTTDSFHSAFHHLRQVFFLLKELFLLPHTINELLRRPQPPRRKACHHHLQPSVRGRKPAAAATFLHMLAVGNPIKETTDQFHPLNVTHQICILNWPLKIALAFLSPN